MACESSPWEIPEEKKTVSQKWKRFDLSLLQHKEAPWNAETMKQWKKEFPQFLPLYTQGIMRFGPWQQKATQQTFQEFLNDKDVSELLDKLKSVYPEGALEKEQTELSNAFSAYQYYFPQGQVPQVITFSSVLTYNTIADDSLLGIGLDMYLGGDFEVYPQAGIPKYKFKHFDDRYMTSDAMKAWLMTEFPTQGGQNLLEQMIYYGKINYLLQAFFPDKPDHVFLNYNQQEYNWCKENEEEIWFHFVNMDLLHSIENHQIRKYLGDAPFIAGFPEGSPGRVGQWMGYQIVKAYIDQEGNPSLERLMQEKNADRILQESNYKPKR